MRASPRRRATNTPTSAKSPGRRATSIVVEGPSKAGSVTDVRSSSAWRAVENGPSKKSAAATWRSPDLERRRHHAVERGEHRRQLGGRVGVRDAPDDRAPVADLRVADHAERLCHARAKGSGGRGGEQVGHADHRTDLHAAVDDGRQLLREPAKVDDHGRTGEAEVEERDQALPAGENDRVVASIGEQVHDLLDRLGVVVVERRRLHRAGFTRSRASRRRGTGGRRRGPRAQRGSARSGHAPPRCSRPRSRPAAARCCSAHRAADAGPPGMSSPGFID